MRPGIKFILCLLGQAFLQGCIPALGTNSTPDFSTAQLSAAEFSTRIDNLQKNALSQKPDNPVKTGKIHRELARLHMSPHNPKRDLDQAASELKKYLGTETNTRLRDETESMLELLKDINAREQEIKELHQGKLKGTNSAQKSMREKDSRIKELSRENEALKKRQEELLTDNKKLETTLEKLKFLDLNLEKKRKTFR